MTRVAAIALVLVLLCTIPLGCASTPASTPAPAATTAPAPSAVATTAPAPSSAASAGPIKIGQIAPLTMGDPTIPHIEWGIKMKLDEVGWKVAGRPIELVQQDDGGDPAKSVDAAKRLIEVEKVDAIIGPVVANTALAVTAYTAESKVPQMTIVQMPTSGNLTGGNNVFSIGGTQRGITGHLGVYAAKQGYKTASIIRQDMVAGEELAKGFTEGFTANGGKVVQEQKVALNTMDFTPVVTGLREADVVVAWLLPQNTLRLLPAYLDSGFDKPFWLLYVLPEAYLEQIGDRTLGMVSITPWCQFDDNPVNEKFVKAWRERYKEDPLNNGVSGYEQTSFLLAALEATKGDTTPSVLNEAIRSQKLELPSGFRSYDQYGIAVGDIHIVEAQKVDGDIYWVSKERVKQVGYVAQSEIEEAKAATPSP